MSDLRVALVSEGPTDTIVIEAALKALLPRPFVMTVLQPEPTRPALGSGWGGVLRWCLEFSARGVAGFEMDPLLPGFDLYIVHADADVAGDTYSAVSPEIEKRAIAAGWPILPSGATCPPASTGADVVRACLIAWTGIPALGPKSVLCVPSKSTDAWLAAAVLGPSHQAIRSIECHTNVAGQLAALPKQQRIKKSVAGYRAHSDAVTGAWQQVRSRCTQAERFSIEVAAVFP